MYSFIVLSAILSYQQNDFNNCEIMCKSEILQ